jgi:hypothetical protein
MTTLWDNWEVRFTRGSRYFDFDSDNDNVNDSYSDCDCDCDSYSDSYSDSESDSDSISDITRLLEFEISVLKTGLK